MRHKDRERLQKQIDDIFDWERRHRENMHSFTLDLFNCPSCGHKTLSTLVEDWVRTDEEVFDDIFDAVFQSGALCYQDKDGNRLKSKQRTLCLACGKKYTSLSEPVWVEVKEDESS